MMKGAKITSYFINFLCFFEISTCTIDKLFRCKSKIFSEESIITLVNPSNGLALRLNPINNAKIWVKFDFSCLKQDIVFLTHEAVVIILFFYKLDLGSRDLRSDFTLRALRFYARI